MEDGLEGTVLGRYRVGRLLGSGGMGSVYAGVQEPLGRPVAIKVLRPEISQNAEIVARFKREAEVAASLSHPNIAQVTDFGVDDGRAFLVMDLLEGESLAALLEREGRLAEGRAQRIGMQILTALAMAHERGIVHRDLKPENVFVQHVSGMELVKLLDFGIARMLDTDHSMTNTGAVLGTPAYMSPEQARGRRVDARSDVFSLGAVLYQMLAGRRAFAGENYHELMFAVVEQSPTPLAEIDREISPALAQLVERAMNKTPEARFESAKEMRDALASVMGLREHMPGGNTARDGSPQAFANTMPSEPRAVAPLPRRGVPWLAIGAPLGLGGAALLAWLALGATREPTSPVAAAIVVDAGLAMQPVVFAAHVAGAVAAPIADPSPVVALAPVVEPSTAEPSTLEPSTAEPSTAEPGLHPPPRARTRSGPLMARCGPNGDENEVFVVGPRDRIVVSSAAGLEGVPRGGISALRAAVGEHADAIAACYRGHPLQRGQDYDLRANAEGRVERVEPRVYCPIDPSVVSCMRVALGEVVVPAPTGSPIAWRVGVDILGL